MSRCPSTYSNCLGASLALLSILTPANAQAQACCAGSAAVAPTRLGLHDDHLLGFQTRTAAVIGSYDQHGTYLSSPRATGEVDFEQDLYGTLRILERGQLSLVLPLVEIWRKIPGRSEAGWGPGDVTLSARYDITLAGQSQVVPGIGLLASVTLPTGAPPESASQPLATDATGVGTWQGGGGLALEQIFGPWLFGVSALVTLRAPRDARGVTTTLAPQLTLIGAAAYTFENQAALALYASWWTEGDATVNGVRAIDSSRNLLQLTVAGLWPIDEDWRLHATLYDKPPLSGLGMNEPSGVGASVGIGWLSR